MTDAIHTGAIPELGKFSEKVLRYFLTFLQTDFKKVSAPRRKVQLKSDVGFRTGIPLRKYATLYKAVWKLLGMPLDDGLSLRIAPGQFTAPISATLRDLIRQHIDAIEAEVLAKIVNNVMDFAEKRRSKAMSEPEKFIESVQTLFVEEVGTRLVAPLLTMLDGAFRSASYSAIESVYEVEADLTDNLVTGVLENMPPALNTLIVTGRKDALTELFAEMFDVEDMRARAKTFFEDFATSDVFQELRDLVHAIRSAENQSLYLYFCDLRFGSNLFPLFYVAASIEFDEASRAFQIDLDPHLMVNKAAVDWVLQEMAGESAKVPLSPVADRIIYLKQGCKMIDEIDTVMARLVPAFDITSGLDLNKQTLQQVSSPVLKVSTSAYLSSFDRSDEAMVNDYEALLAALQENDLGAKRLFGNIIEGFLFENPVSVAKDVDAQWEALPIHERLVTESPIPINEEQRKLIAAMKDPRCNYLAIEGPPGTGKSHTITALAFNGILEGKSVLILSDKTEALDVVEDKLTAVLDRVRHGSEFPNPILRLGKTGNSYGRLTSGSAKEKIRSHYKAMQGHAARLEAEATEQGRSLRENIDKTVKTLTSIELAEINALHVLEGKIESLRAGLTVVLRNPKHVDRALQLNGLATQLEPSGLATILARLEKEPGMNGLAAMTPHLQAWSRTAEMVSGLSGGDYLSLFTVLEHHHHPVLLKFVAEYEELRMPVFGWLFRGGRLQALNVRVAAELPCPDPIDLHKRLDGVKQAARTLGQFRDTLSGAGLESMTGFAWRLARNGEASMPGVSALATFVTEFASAISGSAVTADEVLRAREFESLAGLVRLMNEAARYASLWHSVASKMASVPNFDYVEVKTKIEQLHSAKMTHEIDRRFLEFVEEKKATAKAIGGVIKSKAKFPEEEFQHLAEAFPVIIASIRDYAEYVPLKEKMIDLVIIDEASQVSVAQALPAILRAKKAIVFGDQKQFSSIKSAQASNMVNAAHLTDIEAYFRAHVSEVSTLIERLKYFDVKQSILSFFALIANYSGMLKKHFRGYHELISFSSKHFYDGELQAIKIRSKPLRDVLRFEVLEDVSAEGGKNTNRKEAEFILNELRRMVDEGIELSVGVISPFREQVKCLNDMLFRDAYGEKFESQLDLKIMTFDTCQGEERDLIVFSMVATRDRDALNYIFPVDLNQAAEQVEDVLKAQRLNVGFSRAKEGMLFVLSKPVEEYRGSIGRALMHYKMILEDPTKPTAADVDPASPMEAKVLDWLVKTPFYQKNEEDIELIAQFPMGEYLKQLDPLYAHPAYRVDFLMRYFGTEKVTNLIIEYDGFEHHFKDHGKIHCGNWDKYYVAEDIERQTVLESYGYKVMRLNRFNLGSDPVSTLSNRLGEMIAVSERQDEESHVVASIKGDASALADGSKKQCPKCGQIHPIQKFWDPALKGGTGSIGRNCMPCKKPKAASRGWRGGRWKY